MAEGLTSRWLLFYLAVAGAVLSKGPAGALLPASLAIIWSAVVGRRPSPKMRLVPGLMVVVLLAGGWYAAAIAIGGSRFVLRQLVNENFFAFFHSSTVGGGHNHSFLWLNLALLAGWLPWSPLLPWVGVDLAGKRPGPRSTYLVIWVLMVVSFYGLAHQKRGIYLLAMYPALAVLTADFLRQINLAPALPRLFPLVGLSEGVSFAALALGQLTLVALTMMYPDTVANVLPSVGIGVRELADSMRAQFIHYATLAWLIPIVCLLFGLGLVVSRFRPLRLWGMVVGAMNTVIVAAHLFFVPAIANSITLKQFTEESVRVVGQHSIAYLIGINYEFSFYSRRQVEVIASPGADGPDYLLADAGYYHSHAGQLDDFEIALQSGPANLDGSGAMVLLRRRPRPQRPGQ
jgi:hypothetical protein